MLEDLLGIAIPLEIRGRRSMAEGLEYFRIWPPRSTHPPGPMATDDKRSPSDRLSLLIIDKRARRLLRSVCRECRVNRRRFLFRSDYVFEYEEEGGGRQTHKYYYSRGGRRKGTNRYHFGVIGTGRRINLLNPRSSLRSALYFTDDNCKYIDDTSTSAPPEALLLLLLLLSLLLLLRNLYYNRYTSVISSLSLYYSEKGRERE